MLTHLLRHLNQNTFVTSKIRTRSCLKHKTRDLEMSLFLWGLFCLGFFGLGWVGFFVKWILLSEFKKEIYVNGYYIDIELHRTTKNRNPSTQSSPRMYFNIAFWDIMYWFVTKEVEYWTDVSTKKLGDRPFWK